MRDAILSPWFNALKEPPVNGGDHSLYEMRCQKRPDWKPPLKYKWAVEMNGACCHHCEWRGYIRQAEVSVHKLRERLGEEPKFKPTAFRRKVTYACCDWHSFVSAFIENWQLYGKDEKPPTKREIAWAKTGWRCGEFGFEAMMDCFNRRRGVRNRGRRIFPVEPC